ncbi:MAG: protein-L-isoaspartate carboxylmethyltransferase [uncultured archaeon A07HN63]|nr:MAG: protein-L-isoaspartate carboxylmethyltransferase [uncultured archaeon A07HN63]
MDHATLRADMVDRLEHNLQQSLGPAVLDALQSVPRHEFVDNAYEPGSDEVAGSRVLGPRTVARLVGALDANEGDETLVVGAGVGYTAAVLAEIVGGRHVHAVDIDRQLVHLARDNLAAAGYDAVLVDCHDGARGFPEYAPFDRVLIESAVVDPPRAIREQLGEAGRIVFPRGTAEQTLVAVEADSDGTLDAVGEFGPVRFRPMLVDGEQPSGHERNRTRREDAEFDSQGYFAKTGWEYEWLDWDERLESR